MKSIIPAIALLLLAATRLSAQPGHNALGLRLTLDGAGITLKNFVDRSFAVETQFNVGGLYLLEGVSVYVASLIEYHLPFPSTDFRIIFGGGLHFGVWTGRPRADRPDEAIFGLDGIGGIEYVPRKLPISISGDLKPSLNYLQEVEFFPHAMIGISLRYYFGSNRVKPVAVPPVPGRRRR